MAKKEYARSLPEYDKMLENAMAKLGVEKGHYVVDRDLWHGGRIEWFYKGKHWAWERTKEIAAENGEDLKDGKAAYAQLVQAFQDLVRMERRGIFDFASGGMVGMKMIEAPVDIPSYFKFMGFTDYPTGPEEVKTRHRELLKKYHPDHGGTPSDFQNLKKAYVQAMAYFE